MEQISFDKILRFSPMHEHLQRLVIYEIRVVILTETTDRVYETLFRPFFDAIKIDINNGTD